MAMDTPRSGDIPEHNRMVDQTLTDLALVNLVCELERAGLRVRQISGASTIHAWDPRRGGESVAVVMCGGNTARAVEEVQKEIRRRQRPTLPHL